MRTAVLLIAAAWVLLAHPCSAQTSRIGPQVVFATQASSVTAFGVQKLDRVNRRTGFHSTVQELAATLDRDADLGVDLANERLLYSCTGLRVQQGTRTAAAAAAAAVRAAALDAAAANGTLRASMLSFPGFGGSGDLEASVFSAQSTGGVEGGAPDSVTTEAGAAAATAAADGGRHHHHHHHRRKLMQTGSSNAELASAWLPEMSDAATDEVQAFTLHSRPAAVRKIYLDFDGHTTTGADWNVAFQRPEIITPAFDMDGDPTSWSPSELSAILAVWRGVSEDYAPWDVDVTTEQPSASYPLEHWVRVAIGGSGKDWLGSESGGVAYVNAWGRENHILQPAFVFARDLQNYPKAIWEAASHEVGHNLGLRHDGDATNAYYQGRNGWAPIMGMGHEQAITQWSKGEYTGANNLEDDIQIISQKLPLIPDGYGNSMTTAAYLGGSMAPDGVNAIAKVAGVIRDTSDADVFQFQTNTEGKALIQVLPAPIWTPGPIGRTNLNVQVMVLDAAGALVAMRIGPGVKLFTVDLPAASTYYISLQGVGSGDPTTDGFSNYGSLGQYQLFVRYPSTQLPTVPSLPPTPPLPPNPPPSSVDPRTMSITMEGSRSTTMARVLCSVTVIVTDAETGEPLTDVYVGGTWSARRRLSGWPHDVATSTSDTSVAILPASGLLSTAKGQGCVFRLVNVVKSGYVLSWNTRMISSLNW